ncbi:MAG: hypothetical protein RMA76_43310 [Deltaproteobacteria bacterium]|jgi:hypothetical protein
MKVTRPAALASLVLSAALVGCPGETKVETVVLDASVPDYTKLPPNTDEKGLINNLIGRWYPDGEITRLDDDTMVPEAWCARPPTKVQVKIDEVIVQCDKGDTHTAPIARVQASKAGGIELILRARDDAVMKRIHFAEVMGASAKIEGTPCYDKLMSYARFPKFETLQRSILGGKRCSQVIAEQNMIR